MQLHSEKYGYYQTEERAFKFARKRAEINGRDRPSLEAQIMDYADDLTYAIHDMTDFYKSGFIPLDTIFRESTNSKKYSGSGTNEVEEFTEYLESLPDFEMHYSDTESLFTRLSSVSPNYDSLFTPFKGTERERQQIEQFTSSLIRWYLSAEDEIDPARIEITKKEGRYQLWPHVWVREEVDILRKLTEYYVIRDPKLAAQQEGERKLVRELFDLLYANAEEHSDDLGKSAIPRPYREWLDPTHTGVGVFQSERDRRARIIADMISAMTEPQAVRMYNRLSGEQPGELVNKIMQ